MNKSKLQVQTSPCHISSYDGASWLYLHPLTPDASEEADEEVVGGVGMTMVRMTGLLDIRVSMVVSDVCGVCDEGEAKGDEVWVGVISKS